MAWISTRLVYTPLNSLMYSRMTMTMYWLAACCSDSSSPPWSARDLQRWNCWIVHGGKDGRHPRHCNQAANPLSLCGQCQETNRSLPYPERRIMSWLWSKAPLRKSWIWKDNCDGYTCLRNPLYPLCQSMVHCFFSTSFIQPTLMSPSCVLCLSRYTILWGHNCEIHFRNEVVS